jgi:hypothetical protein
MKKVVGVIVGVGGSVLVFAGNAFAAADTTLSAQTASVQSYFQDNIGTVIGLFIGVALLLWLLSMAFRSVGAKKPSRVV